MSKSPSHRIRRPTSRLHPLYESFDAMNGDIDERVLKIIAAFGVEFNYAEYMLDECFHSAIQIGTKLAPNLGFEVSSRINGMDGKVEIIKAACHGSQVLTGEPVQLISETLAALLEFKGYRDALIHARIEPRPSTSAVTFVRRGKSFEVDLSMDTLSNLYSHMYALGDEVVSVFRLLEHNWPDRDLLPDGQNDPAVIRQSEAFLESCAQVRQRRSRRQSLPSIPEFPLAPPSPEASG